MLTAMPDFAARVRRVLCLGAHADDIEIGCGGTLLELSKHGAIEFSWVVFSAEGTRADEARTAAKMITGSSGEIRIETYRERHFPSQLTELKDYFDDLGRRLRPDVVFAPRMDDAHQDHRVIGELAWQTFRDHLILHYEIPKYEGDLGRPNCYVALPDHAVDGKINVLFDAFVSQHSRDWFDERLFRGLLRVRGVECRAPSGYAEAFHSPKMRLW